MRKLLVAAVLAEHHTHTHTPHTTTVSPDSFATPNFSPLERLPTVPFLTPPPLCPSASTTTHCRCRTCPCLSLSPWGSQGLVPDFVLAKESTTAVRCTFSLRSQFGEYTWRHDGPMPAGARVRSDELSLASREVTFTTRDLTEAERRGEWPDEGAAGGGGRKRGPKAARKFKEAILLDNGVTLHVNGPGEVSADRGTNESMI